MLTFTLLLIGLAGLWLGTELAVRATLRIARARGLSQSFVGLTLLAVGTDVPEWVMSFLAALGKLQGTDASGVVVGSAVGSCLGQLGLVLGIAGLAGYISLSSARVWSDGIVLLGSIVLFALVATGGQITRVEGGILLTSYVVYFVTLVRAEHKSEAHQLEGHQTWKDGALCALGLLLVAGFSHLVLVQALQLSIAWGMQQTVVGLLLVGVGTSLPELALSVTAVRKKAGALSAGNIVGSNIFDMLVPPGTAALIAGIEVGSRQLLTVDLPVLFALSLATLFFFTRKRGLQRWEALTLLCAYFCYMLLRLTVS